LLPHALRAPRVGHRHRAARNACARRRNNITRLGRNRTRAERSSCVQPAKRSHTLQQAHLHAAAARRAAGVPARRRLRRRRLDCCCTCQLHQPPAAAPPTRRGCAPRPAGTRAAQRCARRDAPARQLRPRAAPTCCAAWLGSGAKRPRGARRERAARRLRSAVRRASVYAAWLLEAPARTIGGRRADGRHVKRLPRHTAAAALRGW
jgi:hypothetical protein